MEDLPSWLGLAGWPLTKQTTQKKMAALFGLSVMLDTADHGPCSLCFKWSFR
jgi:hypothetical protein